MHGPGRRKGVLLGPSSPEDHKDSFAKPAEPMAVPAPGEMPENPEWLLAAVLSRLGTAISKALEAGARHTGLTGTQISALYFARFSRPQFATVGNLARVLGVSHVTVVRSIGPLIERGYLERKTGRDRRTTHLVITESGAEALEVAFQQWHRLLLDLASAMPPGDTGNLAELLIGLTQDLGTESGMSDFGPCRRCEHLDDSAPPELPGNLPTPRCREFDVPMEPEDMNLGCPHFKPVARGTLAATISDPRLRAPR